MKKFVFFFVFVCVMALFSGCVAPRAVVVDTYPSPSVVVYSDGYYRPYYYRPYYGRPYYSRPYHRPTPPPPPPRHHSKPHHHHR